MHRFYLPPKQSRSKVLSLTGSEAHHASHVLRVRTGDRVLVLDGAGGEYSCQILKAEPDNVQLDVVAKRIVPPLACHITLVQALPRGKLIESIIQKATELGVSCLVPLLSERVVSRLEDAAAPQKQEKWQNVAIEAIKQCGSAWLPRVERPATPQEFLSRKQEFDLSWVGSLQNDSGHPREFFRAFEQQHRHRPRSVCIWIGPEGDFTPGELQLIKSSGARPITLGRLVLRTETAALYCLSVLNYEVDSPAV